MKTRAIVSSLLVALALVAPAIWAQKDKQAPELDTSRFGDPTGVARKLQGDIYGVIKEIKDKELILDKTKFGVDTSIELETGTKYVRDGKAGKFDQLKVGDPVYVQVKKDKKTGTMTAKRITSGVIAAP